MTDFIAPTLLDQFKTDDTPLRITQSFIDVVNANADAESTPDQKAVALARGIMVVSAGLEAKLNAVMRVLGVSETQPPSAD